MKKLVVLIVLAGLGYGGWYGYEHYLNAPTPPSYQLGEISRASVISTVSATGTIEPLVKVIVGSQVSGTIIKWNADFNAPVEKDAVLAELDQDRYRRALDQRVAAVAVSNANAEQAKVKYEESQRELGRLEDLLTKDLASEKEVLDARGIMRQNLAASHAADAAVLVAEAERKAAAVDVDKTIIRSPIAGVVISRDIDAGQTVAAAMTTPQLYSIAADLKNMRVNANVSENDIGQVREGMSAEFTVDAYPGRKFLGRVGQVRFNPTIVENVVTYTTLIEVNNEDLALRPGMTATIAFEVARDDDALVVPNAALRFKPGLGLGESGPGGPPGGGGGRMGGGGMGGGGGGGGGRPRGGDGGSGAMAARGPASSRPAGPLIYRLVGGSPVPIPIKIGLTDGTNTQLVSADLKEGTKVIVGQAFDARQRPYDPARAMQMMR